MNETNDPHRLFHKEDLEYMWKGSMSKVPWPVSRKQMKDMIERISKEVDRERKKRNK